MGVRFGRGFPMHGGVYYGNAFPPSPPFDAVGAGAASDTNSWSWPHTISGNALTVGISTAWPTPTLTVNVGSTPMVQLNTPFVSVPAQQSLTIFGLMNPPTGPQTISVTSNVTTRGSMNSVSYSGATGFGTVQTASGSSTSLSQVVSAAPGQRVFQMFSAQAGHNITGYNQTSRYSVAASSSADALVIGDAPAGAGTVGFTATTDAVVDWGGVAVPIL